MRQCATIGAGPPYALRYTLTCDGDHGLFGPPSIELILDGTEFAPVAASRAGWSSVPERELCPECAARRGRVREQGDP